MKDPLTEFEFRHHGISLPMKRSSSQSLSSSSDSNAVDQKSVSAAGGLEINGMCISLVFGLFFMPWYCSIKSCFIDHLKNLTISVTKCNKYLTSTIES